MRRRAWPISIGLGAAVGLLAWVLAGAHMTPEDAIVAGAIATGVGWGVWTGLRRPGYDWSSPSLPKSYKEATRAALRAIGGLRLPSLLAGLAFAVLVWALRGGGLSAIDLVAAIVPGFVVTWAVAHPQERWARLSLGIAVLYVAGLLSAIALGGPS